MCCRGCRAEAICRSCAPRELGLNPAGRVIVRDSWLCLGRAPAPQGNGKPVHEDAQREKVPDERLEPANVAPAGRAHWRNFLECVRSRKLPNGDVYIGHRSAAASHLGNIAYLQRRRLRYNPDREEILPL